MNVLSLCSGIGGLDIGIRLACPSATTVCYVEGELYCAANLVASMQAGVMDEAPIWSDVRTFDGGPWRGLVDCVTAGYPCQPFSVAGSRGGALDPRHLWPSIARIIGEVAPAVVFCENVPGHLSLGFDQVCRDLHKMGYRIAAGIFSAAEVGAPHERERLFFVAVANTGEGSIREAETSGADGANGGFASGASEELVDAELSRRTPAGTRAGFDAGCESVAHAIGARLEGRECEVMADTNDGRPDPDARGSSRDTWPLGPDDDWRGIDRRYWPALPQSELRRMADGGAARTDRLRALGNAVVPLVAAHAFRTLAAEVTFSLGGV